MANMETISKEEILHIAKLSSLKIKDEEIEEYRKNLQDIVNFADTINSLDTSKIEVTNGTSSNVNVFREDEVEEFKDKGDQCMYYKDKKQIICLRYLK